MEQKLFVGGYYDKRIFKGEHFYGETPFFGKDINTYSLSEVLKLDFIEGVKEWAYEVGEKMFEELTEEEQIKAIIDYTESDEVAGLLYFHTENEAVKYKEEAINKLNEIEKDKNVVYVGTTLTEDGFYREIFEYNINEA